MSTSATGYTVGILHAVCRLAGSSSFLDDLRRELDQFRVRRAVRQRDTAALFAWLMRVLSYQGISDAVAEGYLARHGSVTWDELEEALGAQPTCRKLRSYWHFHGCRFHKGSRSCAEPDHLAGCPLPRHPLRNGRLNQTAYSLFLFLRDMAAGDLVGWIDRQLDLADDPSAPDRFERMGAALVGPLCHVQGVSNKVATMALSDLLLGAGDHDPRWAAVGGRLIVVDTLVHNFLQRTGILQRLGAEHRYGPRCYGPQGCATVVANLSRRLNAREFNPDFPAYFPRFVQHAIWRYCAADVLDVCNGNRIDDRHRCENAYCPLFSMCDRETLVPLVGIAVE